MQTKKLCHSFDGCGSASLGDRQYLDDASLVQHGASLLTALSRERYGCIESHLSKSLVTDVNDFSVEP